MSPNPPPIDLSSGFPAPSLNPIRQLNYATNNVFSNPDIWQDGMMYGPDAGYEPLRENLARWLSGFYHPDTFPSKKSIDAERICITGGASQNLACLLQVFTDPMVTRNIFIVEPGYFLSWRIFEDAGFHGRLRGVPEDEEGIDLAFLEEMLKREGSSIESQKPFKPPRPYRKLYRHVIYCVPTFSNPSGRIMSLSRRNELVRLSRKYDALIIADDVYDFVHWQANLSSDHSAHSHSASRCILPRLVDIDRTLDGGPIGKFGNCVSNGSFSKLVGPGCRVGWAEGTPGFAYGLSQAGSSRSGGAPSHLMSTFINEMLHSTSEDGPSLTPMTTHILNNLIPAYSRRHGILMSAIIQYLCPLGIILPVANQLNLGGGFFIWLELPQPLKARDVVTMAREDGMIVGNGAASALPDGNDGRAGYDEFIRLCFAWADEDCLEEGVKVLERTLRRLLREQPVSKI